MVLRVFKHQPEASRAVMDGHGETQCNPPKKLSQFLEGGAPPVMFVGL